MPNHTHNQLRISPLGIWDIFDGYCEHSERIDPKLKELLSSFSLEKVIPQPRNRENWNEEWYSWRCENWNTKWDAYEYAYWGDCSTNKDETIDLFKSHGRFSTAWSPPIPVVKKMQEMFPEYEISLRYLDEGWHYIGQLDHEGDDHCLSDDIKFVDMVDIAVDYDFIDSVEREEILKELEKESVA